MKKDLKNKKHKIWVLSIVGIVVFFMVYAISFKLVRMRIVKSPNSGVVGTNYEKGEIDSVLKAELERERNKSPMQKFNESKKLYISDESVSDIKIEGESLDTFKRIVESFVQVRDIDKDFNPLNTGKNRGDLIFKTDFNYFVLQTDNKRANYKVPVSIKKDFRLQFRRMIYTSVEFISNGDAIDDLVIYCGNTEKKPLPWKRKTIVRKILYKKQVGKIQPEKSFERTKENFTIKIDKAGVDVSIHTMGQDFIKVICGDNTAYYEVYPDLYNYLKNDVFKD